MSNQIGYDIEIEGMKEQLEKLVQYDRIVNRHLVTAMRRSVEPVVSRIIVKAPQGATKDFKNHVGSQVIVEGPGSVVGKVGSNLDAVYPRVIEFGRKPGKMPADPGQKPPAKALILWAHRVMGVPDKDARSVAWVVARNIARRGIKGKHLFKNSFEKSKPQILKYFKQALDRIAQDLSNGRR